MGKLKKLKRSFFMRKPQQVARELLGKYLVRKIRLKRIIAKIVETEAYGGTEDMGCHVSRFGRTKRTETLFSKPGLAYIYPVHINTYCFNIVSHRKGEAGGVLIRACEPVSGMEYTGSNIEKKKSIFKVLSGPGKLCKNLKIDISSNREDILGDKIFITEGEKVNPNVIRQTERINIPYADDARYYKWRYIISGSPSISVKENKK